MICNCTMIVHNRPYLTEQSITTMVDDPLFRAGEASLTVVDDGSSEDTSSLLTDMSDLMGIHLIRNETGSGTGRARNQVVTGIQDAWDRGEFLYLSDNDCAYTPGWLTKLVAAFEAAEKYGFKSIGAYNHPFHHANASIDIGNGNAMHQIYSLASQSMLMRWSTWETYGPFAETPVGRVCMGDDVEFCNRIVAAGGKVGVISPNLMYNCGITNSFGDKIPGWELVKGQIPEGVYCE